MKGRRRVLEGVVTSNAMDKTVVVRVEALKRHRLYGKVLRAFKKYKAHDEGNECQVGDRVAIVESRPLSREKRWVVQEILRRARARPEVAGLDLEVYQQ